MSSTTNWLKTKDAMQEFFTRDEYNCFITLNFYQPRTLDSARTTLKVLDKKVCKKLLGKKYWRHVDRRPRFVAFPEKPTTNAHWHLLAHYANRDAYCAMMEQEWSALVESGQFWAEPINTSEDKARIASYCLKDQKQRDMYENFILSSEFIDEFPKKGR